MAIYHCRFKVHSRGQGATAARSAAYRSGTKTTEGKGAMPVRHEAGRTTSAVRSAAYRSGSALSEKDGEIHDFTRKSGIVWTGILTPEDVPAWADRRNDLWREVEAKEKRKDAQLFREVEISIPRELSPRDRLALVRSYVQDVFVDKGMVADIAIHCPKASDGGEQPHAHVMLTMREIGPGGFGNKKREWNDRGFLQTAREAWERYCNAALEVACSAERVDHRTLEAQGRDHEPVGHLGRAVHVEAMSEGLAAKREHHAKTHFLRRAFHMARAVGRNVLGAIGQRFASEPSDDFAEQARRMHQAARTVSRQGGYRYAGDGVAHAEETARTLRGEDLTPLPGRGNVWEPGGYER